MIQLRATRNHGERVKLLKADRDHSVLFGRTTATIFFLDIFAQLFCRPVTAISKGRKPH